MDPATGILTVLGPAPTASLLIGFSAYDHATKRIYEFGEGELYALDGVTGVLLFTTPLAMQTFNQLYNPIVNDSGQIVVLRLGNPTGTATLDPVTGSLTDLAATPYNDGFGQAMRAFDPTTNRVYQFGNFFVLTIDGATGSVLANTPLTDKNFWNPVVNNAGEIIGVNGESPQHIARLDPATGVVTNLAPYSGEAEMGGMTFDPCTNRMYQFYGYKVATIDGTTGATIATVTMAQQNFLNFQAVW